MPDAAAIRDMARRILAGERRAISRAISLVENREPGGIEFLKQLFPHSGRASIVGVTGSPGAGKSTLVEKLAASFRATGARVGIVAVDPTSPFSGGAILGDRIRMQSLANDEGVYIRSMATRGQLGGLAPAAHDAVSILDAAGCPVVIIETVGVGQDVVDVARLAEATVLLLVHGMGDDVQNFKAAVMEIAIPMTESFDIVRNSILPNLLGSESISAHMAPFCFPLPSTLWMVSDGYPRLSSAVFVSGSLSLRINAVISFISHTRRS